jgi:hypothetical protein
MAATVLAALGVGGLRADEIMTHPFNGVTLITRKVTTPRRLVMNIVKVDLFTPGIRFKLTSPSGSRDAIRQTTLDFLRQEHAQLAINAHFYLPFGTPDTNANLAGLAVSEGVVYSAFEPQPIGPGLGDQSYAIIPYAPALNIDRLNHASIVHRDPAYSDNKHVLEPVTLWTAVAGSAQIVCDGIKTIPDYSGPPFGLNPLSFYSRSNSWYSYLEARTAIGLTHDGQTLVMFTVDQGDASAGMTVGEVADALIRDHQVWNALNLDGDGSTTMAMADPVTRAARLVNFPDDGAVEGRSVGSSLALFALPASDLSAGLTITLGAKNRVILSWPASATAWKLQESSTLDPDSWMDADAKRRHTGGLIEAALPNSNAVKFYRLIR